MMQEQENKLIKKVYQLFSFSLIIGAIGAYIGVKFNHNIADPIKGFAFILDLILFFAMYFFRKRYPFNLILLFTFTFFLGFVLTSVITMISLDLGYTTVKFFVLISIAFFIFSNFKNKEKNFTTIEKILLFFLIFLIIAGIIDIAINISILQLSLIIILSILFVLFIFCSNSVKDIIKEDNLNNEVELAISLYFNILKCFADFFSNSVFH